MIKLGLTGYPLGHSLSPKIHTAALRSVGLEGEYHLYPVSPSEPDLLADLIGRIQGGELGGLNVTIPHKQAVIPFLDKLTPSALAIGAVNTIYLDNGILTGHNTDAPGFLADIGRLVNTNDRSALVLGAGGAARAVVYALLSDGWDVTIAVRRADLEQAAELIKSIMPDSSEGSLRSVFLEAEPLRPLLDEIRLVVNATPLGMSPDVNISPWPDELPFPAKAAVYDCVYNPKETLLVRQARAAGLRATTGLGMLVEQAALAFEIWTGQIPPRDVMFAAVEE